MGVMEMDATVIRANKMARRFGSGIKTRICEACRTVHNKEDMRRDSYGSYFCGECYGHRNGSEGSDGK